MFSELGNAIDVPRWKIIYGRHESSSCVVELFPANIRSAG